MADKNPQQPQDDRNIAKVDADTTGLSPEEKLIIAWKKYNAPVLLVVMVLLVFSAVWYGFKTFSAKKLQRIQIEYTQAREADEKAQKSKEGSASLNANEVEVVARTIEFAKKHPSNTLSGYAWIKAGHAYMKVGNFDEAAIHYKAALNNLAKIPEIAGLAHLYHAISTYRSGDKTTGKSELKLVAENKDYLHSHRGEAYYKLGVIALSEESIEEYTRSETALEIANLTHSAKNWLENLKTFRSQFPKEGFDELVTIPVKTAPKLLAPTSVTGGISATGGISSTGSVSPTGKTKKN